jgi:hypothetical protein
MKRRSARNERKRQSKPQRQPLPETRSLPPETPEETVNINGVPVTAREVLSSLIDSRGPVTPFDRALALACVNAICTSDLSTAVKALSFLPPARHVAPSGSTHGAAGYRERVMQLIASAAEADKQERGEHEGDGNELAALRAENVELRRLLSGATPVEGAPKVIDPPTSAIIPPGEIAELYRKPVYPDDAKAIARRNAPVIDAEPAKPAGTAPTSPPAPTKSPRWDDTAGGRAWHAWRDAGGYGDGYPAPFSGNTFKPSY